MGKLADSERQAIVRRIRGVVQKHLQMGIPAGTRVICHNCGYAKPVTGLIQYGRYRLCNDCALEYELAKADGAVQKIEDFILAD